MVVSATFDDIVVYNLIINLFSWRRLGTLCAVLAWILYSSCCLIQTDATLRTFVLLMGLYPDVQRKAQAEMDAHLGSAFERLPTLEDRPHLPYLEAVIKEVLRWNAIAPLGSFVVTYSLNCNKMIDVICESGVPHRISEDIVHEGHFLPKDALIFANIW